MKLKSGRALPLPDEDSIRDYAYHLYVQSGSKPGHDLDHWLEATACLNANIPRRRSVLRLHWFANDPESAMDNLNLAEARSLIRPKENAAEVDI